MPRLFKGNNENQPALEAPSQDAFHAAKASIHIEPEEDTSVASDPINLANEPNFATISVAIDEIVLKHASPILYVLKMHLDSISDKRKQEDTAYEILKELGGLNGLVVPNVEYADAVYSTIFTAIATDYTSDKHYGNLIEYNPAAHVFPEKAKVLRTCFPNFPNLFNDKKVEQTQPTYEALEKKDVYGLFS